MNKNNSFIERFRAKPITLILIGLGSFIGGQIIESTFGQQIQDFFKNHIWSSVFFIDYCLPFIIGIIIPICIVILLFYILFVLNEKNETKEMINTTECDSLNNEEKEFLKVLKDVGIISATTKLSETKFEPKECMKQSKKRLLFMGILGSKWVNAHGSEFEIFLKKIDSKNGEVRFLLINPEGRAYLKLVDLREGSIKEQSLVKLNELSLKYPCLRVKLYDDLPCFRLILIDESIMAVSRYKLDREGYFESNKGWENPHVVITVDAKWSLYDSFEHYYHNIWDSSKDLKDYISDKQNIK